MDLYLTIGHLKFPMRRLQGLALYVFGGNRIFCRSKKFQLKNR